jgi:hypothetical protein
LQKLGFTIAERTVARYLRCIVRRGDPGRKWLAFSQNHREVIAALDFFTVPTVTFRVLYCFFIIEHERRKILHCNVTPHPTAEWIVQQLREAFPEPCRSRYVILDRDRKLDAEVLGFLTETGLEPKRTSVRAPWQNGLAERWIGSCRREVLDHVIALNEEHLRRILRDYVNYHHEDRLHDALEKRHAEPAHCRATAGDEGDGDLDAAAGWAAPSVHVAARSIADNTVLKETSEIAIAIHRPLRAGRAEAPAISRRGNHPAFLLNVEASQLPLRAHLPRRTANNVAISFVIRFWLHTTGIRTIRRGSQGLYRCRGDNGCCLMRYRLLMTLILAV